MESARNQMSFIQEQTPVGDGGTPAFGEQPKKIAPVVVGALIGGLASLIGGLIANRSNKKLVEQANQWSVEQWNRENEYNSPINQMSRLSAAGINPALAYSQGIQNTAATSPSVTSAVGTQQNLSPIDAETASRIALNEAQADKLATEADVQKEKLPEELQKIKAETQKVNKQIEDFQHQWDLMDAKRKLDVASTFKIEFDKQMEQKRYALAVDDLDSLINLRVKQGKLIAQEARKMKAEADFLIKTMVVRAAGLGLENREIMSRIGLNYAEMRQADANAKVLGLDAILKQYDVNAGFSDDWYNQKKNYNLDWNNNSAPSWIRKVFNSTIGITSDILSVLPLKISVR